MRLPQEAAVALADPLMGDGLAVEAPRQEVLQAESRGAARARDGRGRTAHAVHLVARRAPAHPASSEPRGLSVNEPAARRPQPGRLGGPDGVVPVAGADAGVGDLVQDRLADLGLVVQAHEVAAERDPTSSMIRLAGPPTRPVESQVPVADVGLLHEGARQAQDIGQIHGPTVCDDGLTRPTAALWGASPPVGS